MHNCWQFGCEYGMVAYDKNKYYLSGIDWVINTQDYMLKSRPGRVIFASGIRVDRPAKFCAATSLHFCGNTRFYPASLSAILIFALIGVLGQRSSAFYLGKCAIDGDPWPAVYRLRHGVGAVLVEVRISFAVKFDHRLRGRYRVVFGAVCSRLADAGTTSQKNGRRQAFAGEKKCNRPKVNRFLRLRRGLKPVVFSVLPGDRVSAYGFRYKRLRPLMHRH